MELEVKKLITHGEYTGSFKFEHIPPADICLIPLCKIGNIKVCGNFEIFDDDSVEINFTVTYLISGQCSYCLEKAEKSVEFQSQVLFVPEKDDENYYYDGFKLKLDSAVNDAILISQPNILLCKEDCKGIDVT